MDKKLRALPIGVTDFEKIITGGYWYADKSLLIKELLVAKAEVTLIPRPRRFGKTINMSMLQWFFEKHHSKLGGQAKALFDGLAISKEAECMAHQGQYPVIFLTFKDIKSDNWQDCYGKIKNRISAEYERHNYILQGDVLTEEQKSTAVQVISQKASNATFEDSLMNLSFYLQKYYNSKVIILIDEYDSPIHAGFLNNYYDKTISFMRGFLCGGLKDNNSLAFGVLTGILRVARESIFSGMNNLDVNTLLSDHYADKFGFTEREVEALLSEYELPAKRGDVRMWYNGYRVGLPNKDGLFTMIYNPWSMLHLIKNSGVFGPYWTNTSDNKLIQDMIQRAPEEFKIDFEHILAGQSINKTICEDTVFTSLETDTNALWSFLVFSGYLTWETREPMQIKCDAQLVAPNHEVLECFATLIDRWFSQSKGNEDYKNMLLALTRGNIPLFKERFTQSVLESVSSFDVGGRTPERVYHAYVLGMIVSLHKTHAISSNGEAGHGRYDICIIPHDKKQVGTIIEFKAFNKEDDKTMENAAKKALAQIEEKKYEVELRKHGVTHIIKYGIVFQGKAVLIVSA